MLRISKLTDYAVVLASHLALQTGGQSVRDLARDTQIPPPTVSKILKLLAKAEIVISQRGAHGGYSLARPAAEIGIRTVIEAIEGPIAITECSAHGAASNCEYEGSCDTRANWQRINGAIQQALDGISVLDMARPSSSPLIVLGRSGISAAE